MIGLGWVLGAEWALVKQYAPIVEYAVLANVVAGICLCVWRRWRAQMTRALDEPVESEFVQPRTVPG